MRRDANRMGGLKERQGRDGGGREKVTEGMGGMGQDMGWAGTGRERRKGRKREERATVPNLISLRRYCMRDVRAPASHLIWTTHFVNPRSTPELILNKVLIR